MRFALGQGGGHQRRRGSEAGEPVGIVDQTGGVGMHHFAGDGAEMLGEAPAPCRRDLVARLQYRPRLGRLAAAHQPEMPPVAAGQQLDDQRALTVPAHRDDETGVPPFHQAS